MDPIDGELRRALAVDPSPEFLARVRTRIAEAPAPAGRRIPWIAVAPLLTAAALLAVVAIVRRPAAPGTHTADVLIARTAVTPVGVLPAARRAALGHEARPRAVSVEPTVARGGEGSQREPEVLIAPDEARAIRQLIFGVRDGRIALAPALAMPPADLEPIEPIIIGPIPPIGGEQGVRQ